MIISAGIAHRNIRPEAILIDGGTVCLTEFAHATVVGTESQTTAAELDTDRHMLACTILYTLAGGRDTDNQPLPNLVAALQHARVVEAVAGLFHSVFWLESGAVRRTDESGGWVGMYAPRAVVA